MPTYEYECKTCTHRFEIFQNMSEAPLKTCPACGKSVRRLIGGGAGIIFKGSGFYATDNKSSSTVSKKSKEAEAKPVDTAAAGKPATSEKSDAPKEKRETVKSPA